MSRILPGDLVRYVGTSLNPTCSLRDPDALQYAADGAIIHDDAPLLVVAITPGENVRDGFDLLCLTPDNRIGWLYGSLVKKVTG